MNAGISIIPYADELPRIRELARAADTGGLGLVAIQDHPYQHHFLDAFALIATLMAQTRRIGFVTDVANLPLRPPAVLARTAASLDAISGGRFELGLGGGAFAAGIAGFGAERRSPGETVDAVEEAIEVIRLMWSDERSVSFAGRHHRLDDARPGPPAAHPIGLWLGARSGRGCSGSPGARPTAGCHRSARSRRKSYARATRSSTARLRRLDAIRTTSAASSISTA